MKRIVSLGLAALILLGLFAGVLMSAVYASVDVGNTGLTNNPAAGNGENNSGDQNGGNQGGAGQEGMIGSSNVLTDEGIIIEQYQYAGRKLTLVLVDTNVERKKGADELTTFFAALQTANFYPRGDGSIIPECDLELLKNDGERYLRYQITFDNVQWDGSGTGLKFRMYYNYNGNTDEDYYAYNVTADLSRYAPSPDDDHGGDLDDDPVIDPATPYILVQGYDYGGENVAAGSDFMLNVNFYNTSGNLALENIIMKVAPSDGLSITGASNTYYIPTLGANGSMTKAIPIKCLPGVTGGSETVEVTFSYEYVANDSRRTNSTNETISIPIALVERFEVELTDIPFEIWPGDNANVTLKYVNKGRSEIYNLTAKIEGNIDNPNQVQNLGNIKPGDSGDTRFQISSSEPGATVECVITVTYENEKGDPTTLTREFSCPVYDNSMDYYDPGMDMEYMDPGLMEEPVEEGMRWWQKTLFGAGCLGIGGVSGCWTFLKTKRKREEAYDEDI